MPWAWVRPADPGLLARRPLLDLGVGDGQTLAAIAQGERVVGIDRSPDALRAARRVVRGGLLRGDARTVPIRTASVGTVLAADLVHHLDDDVMDVVLREARRVLVPGGVLLAWWWSSDGTAAPDAPAHPRDLGAVAAAAVRAGFERADPLDLVVVEGAGPPTVGIVARR